MKSSLFVTQNFKHCVFSCLVYFSSDKRCIGRFFRNKQD